MCPESSVGKFYLKNCFSLFLPTSPLQFPFLPSHVLPLQMILFFRLYVLIIMKKRRKIQVFTKILISSLWDGHTGTSQPDWEEKTTWSLGKMWIFAGSKLNTHTHINRNWHQLNELPGLPTFLVKESIWEAPFKHRKGEAEGRQAGEDYFEG